MEKYEKEQILRKHRKNIEKNRKIGKKNQQIHLEKSLSTSMSSRIQR